MVCAYTSQTSERPTSSRLATQPDDKIKVQMKEARSGNYYTEVDTYQRKENPAEQLSEQLPVDDNFDDDIPF
jgi:translation initiation factor 1 (eIF-1/SUI1)